MVKKSLLFFLLGVFVIICSGCSTVTKSTKGAAEGAVQGAKEDWAAVKKADDWIRKNLW